MMVKAGACHLPVEYYNAAAKFYYSDVDDVGMLSPYNG